MLWTCYNLGYIGTPFLSIHNPRQGRISINDPVSVESLSVLESILNEMFCPITEITDVTWRKCLENLSSRADRTSAEQDKMCP